MKKMSASEEPKLKLVPSSSIDDDLANKTGRSGSILTSMESGVLIGEDPQTDATLATRPFALSGILYSLLNCSLYVTCSFVMKELQIDPLDALIFRFIIQICLFGVFVLVRRYPVWRGSSKEQWLQFVLCIFNGVIFLGYFLSFRYLPLPDLTTLNFTRLIWTVAFGILFYREKPTLAILVAVCLTMIGVVLVAQPTFLFPARAPSTHSSGDRMIGIVLALTTGLFSALNILIFKQLITLKLKPSVLVLQHSCVFLLCMLGNQVYKYLLLGDVSLFTEKIFLGRYWLSVLVSMLQTLAIIVGNRAIKREPPSVVTIVTATDIILAILLQNIFTTNKSNKWVLIGSALVVSSVFLIGAQKLARERALNKKKKNPGHIVPQSVS